MSNKIKYQPRKNPATQVFRNLYQEVQTNRTSFQSRHVYPHKIKGTDISRSQFDNFYHPSYTPDLYVQPFHLYEERELFRYFYERDPYVGHGIDLLSTLPISKIHHSLPSTANHEKAMEVLRYIRMMGDKINLFRLLMQISHEYWLFGNVFIYVEKNYKEDSIERVVILDPNLVQVETSYISAENNIFLQPSEHLRDLIGKSYLDLDVKKSIESIPEQLQWAIRENKRIQLNTNPYEGSFVYHLSMRNSAYRPYGVPILRRCVADLLYRERLRQAQIQVSMRNMTPKHVITTNARLSNSEVDDLRDQVDATMANPDSAIITTFDLNWNQIGAENRLLQLQSEYDEFNTRLAAGLGLKKELLFGEGVYGDTKLGIDLLEKRFSLFKDELKYFVEDCLWGPICLKKGYVEKFHDHQVILTPGLSFTRMTLRDNETVFANLFQLYQKGSVSIRTILELFNIDPETELKYLQEDSFTQNDSRFNDLFSSLYSAVGQAFAEDPRVMKLIAERGLCIENYEPITNQVLASKLDATLRDSESDSKKVGDHVKLGSKDSDKMSSIQKTMIDKLVLSIKKTGVDSKAKYKIIP